MLHHTEIGRRRNRVSRHLTILCGLLWYYAMARSAGDAPRLTTTLARTSAITHQTLAGTCQVFAGFPDQRILNGLADTPSSIRLSASYPLVAAPRLTTTLAWTSAIICQTSTETLRQAQCDACQVFPTTQHRRTDLFLVAAVKMQDAENADLTDEHGFFLFLPADCRII